MGISKPKAESTEVAQESDSSEEPKSAKSSEESVPTSEKAEDAQQPEEDLIDLSPPEETADLNPPRVSGLEPISEDPREEDVSNGEVQASKDEKGDETTTTKEESA
jgi:hypothetical protein